MLTLEETRWSLKAFKIFSILNILPIQVDVKSGKIKRQSSQIRVFIWKFLFGFGVSHWLYMFGRLVQSTVIEPEKYFKWDHFILHFGMAGYYAAWYFTGFRLFLKTPEENVMIFNQLFEEREDPVQKMMEQQEQLQVQWKSGNGSAKRASAGGKKKRGKSGARPPNNEIEMDVIDNQFISKTGSKIPPRPLLTWPTQYSLDELMAKVLPLAFVVTEVFIILFLAVDKTRPQLLYSVLPPEWQNFWSFLIILAVEALCNAVVGFTSSFAIVTQVLFFGKCQLEFKRLSLQLKNLQEKFQNGVFGGGDIRREIWILRQILAEMRELVVLIELFNRCFPFCIFAWKICSLSESIVCYFFLIRHFHDFTFLGLFMGYLATLLTVTYAIMYGHAFSIPGKMDQLKNEFLLTAQKTTPASNVNGNKNLRAEMKSQIKRIHGVGIKVGSFNQMERESTPNFVDFVLRNVVTLLVTSRR